MATYETAFLAFFVLVVFFDWLERLTPTKRARTALFEATLNTMSRNDVDMSSYHPVFQKLMEVKKLQDNTNPQSEFVAYARRGRELVKLEANWKEVYANMEPDEKLRHDQCMRNPAVPAVNTTPTDSLFNFESIQGWKKFLPVVKILSLWVLAHTFYGWSTWLSQCPLLTIPAGLFAPFLNYNTGKIWFPFNFMVHSLPESAYEEWIDPKSSVRFANLPGGAVLVSFGLPTTLFIMARGWGKLRQLVWAQQSCFRQVLCQNNAKTS